MIHERKKMFRIFLGNHITTFSLSDILFCNLSLYKSSENVLAVIALGAINDFACIRIVEQVP